MTPLDSAAFGFEFVEAHTLIERRTFFAYDSAGSPLYAMIEATAQFNEKGDGWADAARVRFVPQSEQFSQHARRSFITNVLVADTTGGIIPSTPAELAKARALGEWIWSHRCAPRNEHTP